MADAIYVDKDAQPVALVGRVLNKLCRAFAVGSGLTLIAMAMMSTLPVRSPLPNKVPSIRSPPASRANSPEATPVPRSLCGCRLIIACSRWGRQRQKYSI